MLKLPKVVEISRDYYGPHRAQEPSAVIRPPVLSAAVTAHRHAFACIKQCHVARCDRVRWTVVKPTWWECDFIFVITQSFRCFIIVKLVAVLSLAFPWGFKAIIFFLILSSACRFLALIGINCQHLCSSIIETKNTDWASFSEVLHGAQNQLIRSVSWAGWTWVLCFKKDSLPGAIWSFSSVLTALHSHTQTHFFFFF